MKRLLSGIVRVLFFWPVAPELDQRIEPYRTVNAKQMPINIFNLFSMLGTLLSEL
jgi:hypothetical protein